MKAELTDFEMVISHASGRGVAKDINLTPAPELEVGESGLSGSREVW